MDSFVYFFFIMCLLIVLTVLIFLWEQNKPKKVIKTPVYEIIDVK